MSGRIMLQALRTARAEEGRDDRALASHVNLLVLLMLANSANKAGICWPSIPTLADQSRLSARAVRYAIRALHNDAHITVEKRPGRNDRYSVHPGSRCRATPAPNAAPVDKLEPRHEVPEDGHDVPPTPASGADESSNEPFQKSGARLGEPDGPRAPLFSELEMARQFAALSASVYPSARGKT